MEQSQTWAGALVVVAMMLGASPVFAAPPEAADEVVLGVKIRAGGRYDDVRMCVASPAGTRGGPAADISFFMEYGVGDRWAVHVDLPVFRPLLFGASFKMLQFEPSISAKCRIRTDGPVDVVLGPTLGVSLHYGPDYRSAASGPGRGPSFFAMGPTLGGYVGVDFTRPGKVFNVEVGVTPYVTPLFSLDDPADHRGVVIGGLLDVLFRWGAE